MKGFPTMKNLFILLALLLTACAEKETYTISLSEQAIALHYDETAQVEIIYETENAQSLEYLFVSSDTNVVKVDNSGVIYGVAVGEAVITAKAGNNKCNAECRVTVVPYSTLYEEPFFKDGATLEEVKQHINTDKITSERIFPQGFEIFCKGESPVDSLEFYAGNLVGLDYSAVHIKKKEENLQEAILFLTERYGVGNETREGLGFEDKRTKIKINLAYRYNKFGKVEVYYKYRNL
jgi:hypothetical protein